MDQAIAASIAKAQALLDAKRPRDALAVLHGALASAPHDATLHCLTANAELRTAHPYAAIEAARRAIECDPRRAWAYRLLALANRAAGQHGAAVEAAVEAVRLAPTVPEGLLVLAECQAGAGRLWDAETTVTRLMEVAPDVASTHRTRGTVSLRQKKWRKAEVALRRAVAMEPNDAPAWNDLGVALLHRYRRGEAVKAFAQAARLDPTLKEAQQNLRRQTVGSPVLSRRLRLSLFTGPVLIPVLLVNAILSRRHRLSLPSAAREHFRPRPLNWREVLYLAVLVGVASVVCVLGFVEGAQSDYWQLNRWVWLAIGVTSSLYAAMRVYETRAWRAANDEPDIGDRLQQQETW